MKASCVWLSGESAVSLPPPTPTASRCWRLQGPDGWLHLRSRAPGFMICCTRLVLRLETPISWKTRGCEGSAYSFPTEFLKRCFFFPPFMVNFLHLNGPRCLSSPLYFSLRGASNQGLGFIYHTCARQWRCQTLCRAASGLFRAVKSRCGWCFFVFLFLFLFYRR